MLLLPLTVSAQTSDVTGKWEAVFVGPLGPRPKMVDVVTFTITTTPTGLSMTARASNWPGELEVSDVKLVGNRLSFTGTGKEGWSVNRVYHCCPKLVFDGTVRGDEMTLTLDWQTTEGGPGKEPLPMEAKRVSRSSGLRARH